MTTTTTSPQAGPPQLTPSIIRTVVPIIVAQVVAYAAGRGLDLGQWRGILEQVIGAAAGGLYYAGVRILEVKIRPRFGWLLGTPKAPTYEATAKKDPSSPTDESAGPAADVQEGTPVETIIPGTTIDVPQSSDTKADAARPTQLSDGEW